MEYLIKPWAHQLKAIENAKTLRDYALFLDPGTGKTSTAINILRHKMNEKKRFLRTLVICPPIVVRNWKDEFKRHSKIEPGKITLLTGHNKARRQLVEKHGFLDGAPTGHIFVTNYEALLMEELFELLLKWQPEVVIFDESHKCKDYKAKRTKLAAKLCAKAEHRLILSGTPILNSPMDIFSQFLILDGGETFGRNFFAFRGQYFRDRNAGMPKHKYFPDWQIREGALEDINKKIFTKGMRVEKKDCLDLPPLIRQVIKVGMTPQQTKMYHQMRTEFVTFVEKAGELSPVTATLAMTKAMRLMQIASGYAKTADGVEVSLGKTPKLEALEELLTELAPNHKVIVWAVWKENYEQIESLCKRLDLGFVTVTGDTNPNSRFELVDRFNADPNCRVFIGHPGAGGIGINLVASSYSIFYSRNFSLEQSLQAEARNYRGGSEIHDKVTRIDLVCEGTIDELVGEKLAGKEEVSAKILFDWTRTEK